MILGNAGWQTNDDIVIHKFLTPPYHQPEFTDAPKVEPNFEWFFTLKTMRKSKTHEQLFIRPH